MFNKSIGALLLAGGKGTRLHSSRPKVLQTILETPLLQYVYDCFSGLSADKIWTVVGFEHEAVRQAFPDRLKGFILQEQQRGTGHALQVAWPAIKNPGLNISLWPMAILLLSPKKLSLTW